MSVEEVLSIVTALLQELGLNRFIAAFLIAYIASQALKRLLSRD